MSRVRRYVLERSIDKQRRSRRTARMSSATAPGESNIAEALRPENPVAGAACRGALRSSTVLAVMGLVGAASLVAATFLPVLGSASTTRVLTALDRTGWDEHGAALIALAVVRARRCCGRRCAASRPAAVAIALCGLAGAGDRADRLRPAATSATTGVGRRRGSTPTPRSATGLGVYARDARRACCCSRRGGVLAFAAAATSATSPSTSHARSRAHRLRRPSARRCRPAASKPEAVDARVVDGRPASARQQCSDASTVAPLRRPPA